MRNGEAERTGGKREDNESKTRTTAVIHAASNVILEMKPDQPGPSPPVPVIPLPSLHRSDSPSGVLTPSLPLSSSF